MNDNGKILLKQLLAGRDHARVHPVAGQMMNFAYLIGCSKTGQCLAVDPSWDPGGIVEIAKANSMTVTGCVATHGHPDHVGGQMMGMDIPGIREMAQMIDGPIYVHPLDAPFLSALTSISQDKFAVRDEGNDIQIGELSIKVLHTPGHTPGHICLLSDNYLITGDVLFVGACGRTDLPGAEPIKMYRSLQKLSALPEETVVLPGHHYGSAMTSTIGNENRTNPYLRLSESDWSQM